MNVTLQVKIWHLPIDVSHDSVCDPSTTLCTGDSTVDLVLWNPVAENVLASASQQSIKIYDVGQQIARIGNFLQLCTTVNDSLISREGVTKVTFHLPPTATHLLGEWTLPSHALVLCSSEALHLFQRREDENRMIQ